MSDRILVVLPTDADNQGDYLDLSADRPYRELGCPAHGSCDTFRIATIWSATWGGHDRDVIWEKLRPRYEDFLAYGQRVSFIHHPPFDHLAEWQRIRTVNPGLQAGPHIEFSRDDTNPYFATLRQLAAASSHGEFAAACNTLRNTLLGGNEFLDLCGVEGDQGIKAAAPPEATSPAPDSTRDCLGRWRHAALRWRSGFALAQAPQMGRAGSAAALLAEEVEWLRRQPRATVPLLRAEADLFAIAASADDLDGPERATLCAASASLGEAADLLRGLLDRNPESLDDWTLCFRQIDRAAADCDSRLAELNSDPPRSSLT